MSDPGNQHYNAPSRIRLLITPLLSEPKIVIQLGGEGGGGRTDAPSKAHYEGSWTFLADDHPLCAH